MQKLVAITLGVGLVAAVGLGLVVARGSDSRVHAAGSPFNKPIPQNAAVDPRSARMIDLLAYEVDRAGWRISHDEWTTPVYFAGKKTPKYNVALTNPYFKGKVLAGVPIPAHAAPDQTDDGAMAIIDRARKCEYNLLGAKKNPDGSWTARFANAIRTNTDGVFDYAEAARASGFAGSAGLIWPQELNSGRIRHALTFVFRFTKAGGPVRPATGSDGTSMDPGAIPEGARLQLDPSLDIDALGLEPWQRIIAKALQEYGMYLADTGGTVAIQAVHSQSVATAYPWVDEPRLPSSLARHLRVLNLGPQRPVVYRVVPTLCAKIRRG